MESTQYDTFEIKSSQTPERPDFLKILCILSFVACGLLILLCSLGTLVFALDEATIEEVWSKAIETNPQLEALDATSFLHNFGLICVYMLIATAFSLTGVIMMWRMEKMGFYIYVVAELSTHFFRMDSGNQQETSYVGLIFGIAIDLIFIAMYFVNLKHMNKGNNTPLAESGN